MTGMHPRITQLNSCYSGPNRETSIPALTPKSYELCEHGCSGPRERQEEEDRRIERSNFRGENRNSRWDKDTVKSERGRESRSRIADPRIDGPAVVGAEYGAIDRAKFFLGGSAVGSVDSASIGSQANYGRSHCLRYIIRWRSEVSFSSLRFRGEYDQLFVADAVFEGKSGRKRKREDGQRRCAPSCCGVPSLLSSSGDAPPFDTLLVRFSTEVSFGSSWRSVRQVI